MTAPVINLSKGQKIDLTKTRPELRNIKVGLGWDQRSTAGVEFDLDAVAFLINEAGVCTKAEDIVFYNNPNSLCESVLHGGDNLDGAGEGDDEFMVIDLSAIPADVNKVVLATTIHEANENGVTFGQVVNAFVRVVDMGAELDTVDDDIEMARFDLSEDYSIEDAMIMAEIYRHNGAWKLNAVGQGFHGGLPRLCDEFGLAT